MSANDSPLVWTVIPTWNRRDDLLECLASVCASDYPSFHVAVVDNHSEDGSAAAVRSNFPSVKVLEMDHNVGATGASNAGFAYALARDAAYVFRLDSDTVVDPEALRNLVDAAVLSPDIGALTAKVYFHHDPTLIWFAGALGHPWHFGACDTGRYERDSHSNNTARDIDYAWSTGMLISRAALEATGGFDPDFLVYYEEVDFCLRVRRAGFRIRYVPEARIWHKVGSEANSPWVAEQWNRSKVLLFRKHSRGLHRWSLIAYAFGYVFWRAIKPVPGRGNRGPLGAALRGIVKGLQQPL